MAKPLIIVESPAKARTIAGYLGDDYEVASSVGHIRDLPRSASEIPDKYKSEPWAKEWGIDVTNDFEPLYIVPKEKKDTVKSLRQLVKDASELYLATDEDREGEAIAWHLAEVLKPKVPVQRMVFHEITPDAIRNALEHPRGIDQHLVDAQEARRTLDRLVGYGVSPVLWRKVKPRLSAGRVQSVAVRIIVQRERERIAFVPASYWDLEGVFATEEEETFGARLVTLEGGRLATGKDFGDDGRLHTEGVVVLDEPQARPAPCRPPSVCTRTATSPTCVPTVRRWPRSPWRLPGPRSPNCTAPNISQQRPIGTPMRSRMPRRHMRRSGPPATGGRPRRWWRPS